MSDKPIIDDLDIAPVEDTPRTGLRVPSKRPTKPKVTAPPYRERALIEPLTKAYAAFAMGLMPFAPMSANQVMQNAETCAEAWDEWARVSPTVRRMLYPLLNVSGGAKVFAAHLPIFLALSMETGAFKRTPFADTIETWLGGESTDDD